MRTNTGRGRALRAAALALALALAATACSSRWDEEAERLGQTQTTLERRHAGIGAALAGDMLPNAALIERYAQRIAKEVPDAAEIARELAIEATTRGRAYRLLGERIRGLDTRPENESALDASNEEAQALSQATRIETFNAALGDVANVLADLSGGRLARVDGPSGETSGSVGPGELLVGNPSYGRWERQADGTMTWLFAGYLAGLGSRFYHSPGGYHYDEWYHRRPWTYYSDHGRSNYGTARERTRWRSSVERWGDGRSTARRAERARRASGGLRPSGTDIRAGTSTGRATPGQGTGSVSGSRRSGQSTYAPSTPPKKAAARTPPKKAAASTPPKKRAAAQPAKKRRASTWGSLTTRGTRRSSGTRRR